MLIFFKIKYSEFGWIFCSDEINKQNRTIMMKWPSTNSWACSSWTLFLVENLRSIRALQTLFISKLKANFEKSHCHKKYDWKTAHTYATGWKTRSLKVWIIPKKNASIMLNTKQPQELTNEVIRWPELAGILMKYTRT